MPVAAAERRAFWLYWASTTTSYLGDGIRFVALPLLAATLTSSPAQVASIALAAGLPWPIFGLIAGVVVDRLDKNQLLLTTQAMRAALGFVTAFGVATGHVSLILLAVFAFTLNIGEVLYDIALHSYLPALVPEAMLQRANSRLITAEIRICFAGVTGWTAPPILAAIDASDDLTLTSGVSRSAAGQGAVYATAAAALAAAPADVLVDFTSAAAVRGNVRAAIEAGVHVVIGTSGLTADDYAEIDRLARDRGVGVIAAGNFSVMAAVLRHAAAMAARHLGHWEIIDYASDTKPDVPSGTARDLAETLGQVREPGSAVPLDELEGPVEARGAGIGGARVHSVRLPSFVVSTEVVFGGPGERLIMRHDPGLTPAPYVAGTLLAVRRVADAVGVRRGLDSLLFED